jgi:TPR repeat protein
MCAFIGEAGRMIRSLFEIPKVPTRERSKGFTRVLAVAAFIVIALAPPMPVAASAAQTSPASQDQQNERGQNRQEPPLAREDALSAIFAGAERGDAGALLTLGGLYAEGIGVQKNFSKARECYEKAAQAGLAEALYNVGVCWEIGMGSEANPAEAAEYFRKAADMKLPQAMFKMSLLFDSGIGVSRDERASIDYMAKAALAGDPDAASIMGVVWLNGLRGQKKDEREGLRMLEAAASSGAAEAMKNIAVVYKDGIGVEASPSDALKWYLIAGKCGYPAEALSDAVEELRKKLPGGEQRKAEQAADAWIKSAGVPHM